MGAQAGRELGQRGWFPSAAREEREGVGESSAPMYKHQQQRELCFFLQKSDSQNEILAAPPKQGALTSLFYPEWLSCSLNPDIQNLTFLCLSASG